MKKTLILLLSLSMLAGCSQNNNSKTSQDSLNIKNHSLTQKYKSDIEGVWLDTEYVRSLGATKSPYQSKLHLKGVASMFIDLDSVKGDSLLVGYSLNNHEGAQFTLYMKMGHLDNLLKINHLALYADNNNRYELGSRIIKNDTTVILFHLNSAGHVIGQRVYYRVSLNPKISDDAGWAVNYATRKELITGSYSTVDSIGNKLSVRFDSNGQVTGLPNAKNYDLATDFEAGPENNLDQFYFDINAKSQKSYGWKIIRDTLKLYDTKENADQTELILGKLKYKLIKQK